MEKIKPILLHCPFCGSQAKVVEDKNITVECEECTGAIGYFLSRENAIKAWNTRTEQRSKHGRT